MKGYTVVATSLDVEIRCYTGSLGYQVWRSGLFLTFAPTWASARAWL